MQSKFHWTVFLFAAIGGPLPAQEPPRDVAGVGNDLAVIKKDAPIGFANAGWKYDRYSDLPSLDAGRRMVVADIQGPGIIRHIHTTRHQNPDLNARGIVLEITFDDAPEPAVVCPLADFFGDGCNGKSMYFSTPLIECAPWSYNCYFPMPFAKRAQVVLRNDTPQNAMNYSYVEWEPLQKWNPELGYFHATWRRTAFPLTKDTKATLFTVQGPGHLVGRQFSVVTDEPLFRNFNFVMEGNNEVDIDGRERALDYLGTEDSFTFSWGFQDPFAGLRAGMPFIGKEHPGDAVHLSLPRSPADPVRARADVVDRLEPRAVVHVPAGVGSAGAGGWLLGGLRHGVLLVSGSSGGLQARAAAACQPAACAPAAPEPGSRRSEQVVAVGPARRAVAEHIRHARGPGPLHDRRLFRGHASVLDRCARKRKAVIPAIPTRANAASWRSMRRARRSRVSSSAR